MSKLKIGIIVGSTRPGRVAEQVARWVLEQARSRTEADFEIVDIAAFHLPLLDEPIPASMGRYSKDHTKRWAEKVASLDGYIFITPEYNHGLTGALKNAIDFVWAEWNNKAAGIVSYGSAGGVRAAESLRLVLAEVKIADVRSQAFFYLSTDFENYTTFKPDSSKVEQMGRVLNDLLPWAKALKALRDAPA